MSAVGRMAAVAACDLRLTFRDRGNLFWMFLAPALWVYFTGLMARPPASGGGGQARGPLLAVCDQDRTSASAELVKSLEREGFAVDGTDDCATVSSSERRITLPQGLAASLDRGQKVELALDVEADGASLGAMETQVRAHKAVLGFLADRALGPTDASKDDAVRLRAYWMHRRTIPLGYQQAVPGNLVVFILMMTIASGAETLARERRSGVLRRMAASSLTRGELLAGKFLGRLGVAAIEILVFLFIGAALFRIAWGTSLPALVLVLASLAVCAAALSLAAGAIARSPDAASGISVVVILLMSGLGGCFWPAEIAPEWLQRVGLALPTGWAMEGLHTVMSWGGGVSDVVVPALALLGFGLAAFVLALRRLRLEAS